LCSRRLRAGEREPAQDTAFGEVELEDSRRPLHRDVDPVARRIGDADAFEVPRNGPGANRTSIDVHRGDRPLVPDDEQPV